MTRAKDQLLSIGTGVDTDDSFESFNVMQSDKLNHVLREKGEEEKLTAVASTSPQVVKDWPHPSINSKLAGPKVCRLQPEYLDRPNSVTRTERQVAAGFLVMAGVGLVSQWKAIKRRYSGEGSQKLWCR